MNAEREILSLAVLAGPDAARFPASRGVIAAGRLKTLKSAVSARDDPRDFMNLVAPPAADTATICIR